MKTDTLTGPNLSYHVAVLDGKENVRYYMDDIYYGASDEEENNFDYADPTTFQPIAEREKISVKWDDEDKVWIAMTRRKVRDVDNWHPYVRSSGKTEAEARMRCYVKSYLGDDTKGE